MRKVTDKQIKEYFKKNEYSSYKDFSKEFNITERGARYMLNGLVVSSINLKGKYITLIEGKKFNKYGIIKIDKIIFSKHGTIRATILYLVKTYDKINSSSIYSILGINPSQQLTILLKKEQIFSKKQGRTYLYSVHPFSPQVVEKKAFSIQSLDEGDQVLRDLEIVRQVKSGKKKTDVAKDFKIVSETVANICERFEQGQTKALIKKRESKPYKITHAIESAVITEIVKNPEKRPEEIKESISKIKNVSVKSITRIIKKVKHFIQPQKKLVLEIQN